MLLVFFYSLILIILFTILGIIFSKIETDINIVFDNINGVNVKKYEYKKVLYNFNIKLYLFGIKYLNILTIKIDEKYLRIYKFKFNIKKIYLKIIENMNVERDIRVVNIKDIEKLNINFSKISIIRKNKCSK